ncbi:MAG: hypothetical protein CVU84_04245 [Firmicutes bacterium HGW-Firmicutes-1]|jgi:hypothetical protein|nr:MAG: hypothetical protein CVU84_04245 [Firmicutes bacterium HGW-Firmicutes-1]
MAKKMYVPLILLGIVLAVVLSYEITSLILLNGENKSDDFEQPVTYEDELDDKADTSMAIQADTLKLSRISPSTRIVYQYYYTMDDKLVTDECEPPYYLIDMTRNQLEAYYTDWQLISFSSDKVVLRKSINERDSKGYYIIREFEGKMAVFYDYTEAFEIAFQEAVAVGKYHSDEEALYFVEFIHMNKDHYLREILDTPINILSPEEREKLKDGILVYGDEELIRILENYSS